MNRITDTNKWQDEWFLSLSPYGKLVFMFLCDNCNDAGFYSLSSKFMMKQLKIPNEDVVEATREISEKIIFNHKRKKIWIINFLFYQKQLPLDISNQNHKKIKLMLEKNLDEFDDNGDMMFILDNVEEGKKKKTVTRKKFIKPTESEFKDYGKQYADEKKLTVDSSWYIDLYAYYVSNGWKVGKNPMVDWKAAIRKNITKEDKPKNYSKGGNGKIHKITKANQKIKNVVV